MPRLFWTRARIAELKRRWSAGQTAAAIGAALGGEVAPTRCGHAFFGTRHCLFATDAPFDPERGRALIADTLAGVTALGLAEADMTLIFAGNAQRLLRL
jgi:hypothetical protein